MTSCLVQHPLYDLLLKRVTETQNKNVDITRLCSTINSIGQNASREEANFHYNWIGSLILHHEILSNNGVLLTTLPFNCKLMTGESGELFTISHLPPILQQILAEYIDYYAN